MEYIMIEMFCSCGWNVIMLIALLSWRGIFICMDVINIRKKR